ncbi:MAG: nitroreductase family deazaflavin-dependent oxidoreductase [Acidimicrobiales bacterium]
MDTTTPKLPGTPKPWMNTSMRIMLGLPGLRRLLGRSFAMITVTGAKTGTEYSTPVQYMKVDDDYVVLSQKHRIWWRNIRTEPVVTLTVLGKVVPGRARIAAGGDAHQVLSACLSDNPRIAKFYGLSPDGTVIDPAAVDRLGERVVPIVITPDR